MTIEEIKDNIEHWLQDSGWTQEEDTWKKHFQIPIGEMIVNGKRQHQMQIVDMVLKYDGPGYMENHDGSNKEDFTLWTLTVQDQSISFNAVSPEDFRDLLPM